MRPKRRPPRGHGRRPELDLAGAVDRPRAAVRRGHGALLDEVGGICGDVRSTICYDSGSKAYYATSKGGEFIRIKLDATGRKIASKQTLKLQNGTTRVAMSTSTPVVYNGRAYVGVSGSSQFDAYSGHNITVIDLDGAMSIAYRVPTKGYPQASGLLTTAYENDAKRRRLRILRREHHPRHDPPPVRPEGSDGRRR